MKENNDLLLSIREMRILNLVKQALSNYEIALVLHIKEVTVKCHKRNINRKFGIKGKGALNKFLESRSQEN